MEITKGIIGGPKKVLIYGPEGIGKTTFASKFPDPVFIDTEGSTKEMDVARLPAPSSWTRIKEEVRYVIAHPNVCRTLVVDTADWAEKMAIQSVLDEHQKNGIEDFGYGNGYRYVYEKFGELLNLLNDVIDSGIHVVLTAHATLRKFEQPDEMGAYDRYTMKLIDSPKTSIAAAVKEWADMVLFANYKTIVVTDSKTKKTRAQGGSRVMYTTHHSCWDAKNRFSLPDELPFAYEEIKQIIEGKTITETKEETKEKTKKETKPKEGTGKGKETQDEPKEEKWIREETEVPALPDPEPQPNPDYTEPDIRIPKALRDLMIQDKITEWDIENFVESKGWMPYGTKVTEYEKINPDFIKGALVAQWTKVRDIIKQMNKNMEIPFN